MPDVPFPNLFADMVWYAKKQHAEIVFRKCIEAGRIKWAFRIASHYGLRTQYGFYDTVMAFILARDSFK